MRGVNPDDDVVIVVSKQADETFAMVTMVPQAQRLNPAVHVVIHVDMTQSKERFTEALTALVKTTLQMGLIADVAAALEEAEARLNG